MNDFDPPDALSIDDDRLVNICKYRQQGCCKYIVFFERMNDFYCVKNIPEIREMIDKEDLAAQGDNCEGLKECGEDES